MNDRDYQYNTSNSRNSYHNAPGNGGQAPKVAHNGYRNGSYNGQNSHQGQRPSQQNGYQSGYRGENKRYSPAGYEINRQVSPRPGMTTRENPYAKKRNRAIIISLIVLSFAVLFLIILLSPKTVKIPHLPDPEHQEAEEAEITTPPVVEEEPEPVPVYASRTEDTVTLDGIYSQNCILIDVENWTVVAEKGGDEKIFPASMTKVMTALIAAEHFEDLTEVLTVPAEIIDPLYRANATVAGFFPNEQVTVRDVLYGIILPSGADATGTAAITISGSEEEFAKLMNQKCEELGLENTHFTNASGLHDDNHYTTPHDMAIIMRAALENELVREVLGTYEYTTSKTEAHPDGITIYSTTFSRIHGEDEYDDKISMFAGKTGYTGEAGQCLVTAAKVVETGKEYIQVCAKSDDKWHTVLDTINNYRHHLGVEYESDYVLKSQR